MKKYIFILTIASLLYLHKSGAQTAYSSYAIKEHYDHLDIHNKVLQGGYPTFIDSHTDATDDMTNQFLKAKHLYWSAGEQDVHFSKFQ